MGNRILRFLIKIYYKIKMTSEHGRQQKSPLLFKALTQGRKVPNKKVVSEIHTSENQTKYEQSIKLPLSTQKKTFLQKQVQREQNTQQKVTNKIYSIKVNSKVISSKNSSNEKNHKISSQRSKAQTNKNLNDQLNNSKLNQDFNIKQQNRSENDYRISTKQIEAKSQKPRSKVHLKLTEIPGFVKDQGFIQKYSQVESRNLQSQRFSSNRYKKKPQSVNSNFYQNHSIRSSSFFDPDDRTLNQNPSYIGQSTETEISPSIIKGLGDESRLKTKTIQQQQKIKKNLENFRVEFKKIQQIYQEKRLQQQAKSFIQRLKREKRQFQGKIYMIKRNQQQKRKMKFYTQIQSKEQEEKAQRYKRLKNAQKNIELLKQKSVEREKQFKKIQRSKSFNTQFSKIDKKLNQPKKNQQVKATPTYSSILGRRYLRQNGRVKRRVRTQSTDYPTQLSRQERQQLDKIRQKIEQLTKSFRV